MKELTKAVIIVELLKENFASASTLLIVCLITDFKNMPIFTPISHSYYPNLEGPKAIYLSIIENLCGHLTLMIDMLNQFPDT